MDLKQQELVAKWRSQRKRFALSLAAMVAATAAVILVSLGLAEYVMNERLVLGFPLGALAAMTLAVVFGLRLGKLKQSGS
jgi:hypothetical protein